MHSNACGCQVTENNFEALINYFNKLYKDFDYDSVYKVDFIFQGNEIPWEIISTLAKQETLYGQGVEKPLIAIEGFKVFANELKLVGLDKGKPTLNIKQSNGFSLVKFKSSEEEYQKLNSLQGFVLINIVGTCEWNNWGEGGPQIYITDYEIAGRQNYYF